MSLVKYSLAGLPPISQTFGGEVEIRGGGGEVGYGRMCFRWLAHVYILKQTVVPNDLYSFSENRFIHEPSCFPSPALVLLPRRKKKGKKIRTALPGHFGLSVRSLLTIWKKNGAEAYGLPYRNRLSLAFRTIV